VVNHTLQLMNYTKKQAYMKCTHRKKQMQSRYMGQKCMSAYLMLWV